MPSTASEHLSPEIASALIERLSKVQEARRRQRLFYRLFPAQDTVKPDGTTLYARYLYARYRYAKHMVFFAAGADYRERYFMAANRVGKTFGAGGYDTDAARGHERGGDELPADRDAPWRRVPVRASLSFPYPFQRDSFPPTRPDQLQKASFGSFQALPELGFQNLWDLYT